MLTALSDAHRPSRRGTALLLPAAAFAMRRRPLALVALASAVAAVVVTPVVLLFLEAQRAGLAQVISLVDRGLTAQLLWNTARLTLVATAGCAVIGTLAAWLVERTDLPHRRVFAVLLVVPLAIPDFVVSFGWSSLSTTVHGFVGASLVMTLALYPLVYLPVAASLRGADPAQEEVARSLGAGRARTFWHITIGQARLAILGGCLLVALALLAEYGAFEMLGYQTFTTEIFTELSVSFNFPATAALSLVLVALGIVVVAAESTTRGRGRASRADRLAQRPWRRHSLRAWNAPAVVVLSALVVLALGVPVGSAAYWWASGPRGTIQGASILDATLHTALYATCAAALCTTMALPVAIVASRHSGRLSRILESSTYVVMAMPGLLIALALGNFAESYAGGIGYQSSPMLVVSYAIMFFPLALVGVRASVAQAAPGLEEVAGSLGRRQLGVLWSVTRPLVAPGLVAAFCLVFLSVSTELTATLVLVPTGVQTLATQFWSYQQNLSYGQAAPFALMMVALAAVPSYALGRFFERMPTRQAAR